MRPQRPLPTFRSRESRCAEVRTHTTALRGMVTRWFHSHLRDSLGHPDNCPACTHARSAASINEAAPLSVTRLPRSVKRVCGALFAVQQRAAGDDPHDQQATSPIRSITLGKHALESRLSTNHRRIGCAALSSLTARVSHDSRLATPAVSPVLSSPARWRAAARLAALAARADEPHRSKLRALAARGS
jgi:hypothetical protein